MALVMECGKKNSRAKLGTKNCSFYACEGWSARDQASISTCHRVNDFIFLTHFASCLFKGEFVIAKRVRVKSAGVTRELGELVQQTNRKKIS